MLARLWRFVRSLGVGAAATAADFAVLTGPVELAPERSNLTGRAAGGIG